MQAYHARPDDKRKQPRQPKRRTQPKPRRKKPSGIGKAAHAISRRATVVLSKHTVDEVDGQDDNVSDTAGYEDADATGDTATPEPGTPAPVAPTVAARPKRTRKATKRYGRQTDGDKAGYGKEDEVEDEFSPYEEPEEEV